MTNYAFRCPRCLSTRIGVVAEIFLEILQDSDGKWETESIEDYTYDNQSHAGCLTCQYSNKLKAFHASE